MEVTEIQNIVHHNLKSFKTNSPPVISILDYFITRQYINLYNQSFISFALQEVGDKLLKFVSFIDATHPDVPFAFDGMFDLSTDFSKKILECFEVAKLSQANNFTFAVPTLVKDLKRKYSKLFKYMGDVTRYTRLLKNETARDNVRFCAREISFSLAKPHLWPKIPGTFRPYLVSAQGDYYGFKRITMTNAGIILCKMAKCHRSNAKATSPQRSDKIINLLDNYPPANNKAIFDNFWQIDVGAKIHALLGEREKKCYFIICWS